VAPFEDIPARRSRRRGNRPAAQTTFNVPITTFNDIGFRASRAAVRERWRRCIGIRVWGGVRGKWQQDDGVKVMARSDV